MTLTVAAVVPNLDTLLISNAHGTACQGIEHMCSMANKAPLSVESCKDQVNQNVCLAVAVRLLIIGWLPCHEWPRVSRGAAMRCRVSQDTRNYNAFASCGWCMASCMPPFLSPARPRFESAPLL